MLTDKVRWRLYSHYFSVEDLEILLGEASPQTQAYYEWLLEASVEDIRMYLAELIL